MDEIKQTSGRAEFHCLLVAVSYFAASESLSSAKLGLKNQDTGRTQKSTGISQANQLFFNISSAQKEYVLLVANFR